MSLAYDLAHKRVFVAGHRGMVGAALVRRLRSENCEIITAARSEVDLRDGAAVRAFMLGTRPHAVIIAAAKVGGILANDTYPVDFLADNLEIELTLFRAAFEARVEKLLFLGSSCIYPKLAPKPIREDALLTGPLDATLDLVNAAEILLEPLPIRDGESLPQRPGVFEHCVNNTAVAAVGLGPEEPVEGQGRIDFERRRF